MNLKMINKYLRSYSQYANQSKAAQNTYSYANFSQDFFWNSSGFLEHLVQRPTILLG